MKPRRSECRGPAGLSRRRMLQVGGISALGLTLPTLLRAGASGGEGGAAATADACILVFLNGGPSHLDMWDMKPEAPEEIRGPFRPIDSAVPGVQLGEHLPGLAKLMDRCALIRSIHHSVNNAHAAAVYTSLTGHDRGDATVAVGAGPEDYPSIGSVVGGRRPPAEAIVPYVSMPYITAEGRGGPPQPGFFGGWLGRASDPFFILSDPNAPGFGMPELAPPAGVGLDRLAARRALLERSGTLGHVSSGALGDADSFRSEAFDLLTSPATRRALEIGGEDPRVRDRYGRNIYGQSILLARRLIEAGTRVACISWAPDANATWDTHGNNFDALKGTLLPQLDAAVSSLLTDLEDRGMLERTLVVVMGEFGRTPRVNAAAGRDHWNRCYTAMLAGGGIRGGAVFGASDRIGSDPASDAVGPADVVATLYQCLGLSPETELHDRLGRPFALVPWGKPITGLLS